MSINFNKQTTPRKTYSQVVFQNEDYEICRGTKIETNGNLTWIEDEDGKGEWYSPHEWEYMN